MAVQNFGSGGGGFQLSPGLNVSEIDLTTVVPPVATTVGAIAGVFRWGPLEQRVLITSENDLVAKFGRPTSINPETFFTAANFLAYSNALYVSRAANTGTVFSAVAGTGATANAYNTVKNIDDYETKSFDNAVDYIARCPGALGNSLKISVCDAPTQYASNIALKVSNSSINTSATDTKLTIAIGANSATVTVANGSGWAPTEADANTYTNTVKSNLNVGDYVEVGNSSIGKQSLKITSISNSVPQFSGATFTGDAVFTLGFDQPLKLSTAIDTDTVNRYWEYYNTVDSAPGRSQYAAAYSPAGVNDEVHVVVVDEDGGFTGVPGSILEVYKGLSRATDAKLSDGSANYYKSVINERSQYVWFGTDRSNAASAAASALTNSTNLAPLTLSFTGGVDTTEDNTAFADIARAYDLFSSPEEVDIALLLAGKSRGGTHGEQLGN